ncbi:MAG: hypothetical protein WC628_07735 [Candidatus Omnitrophota bacterium]
MAWGFLFTAMNIFVGNILFETTQADLEKLFAGFGKVASAVIVMDKNGRKSRGFAFVDMPDEAQATAAIDALDGREFMDRVINVSLSHPKSEAKQRRIKRKEIQLKNKTQAQDSLQEENFGRKPDPRLVFQRADGRKVGRRTLSFMKRRAAAGIKGPLLPRRKFHDNPLRWRKKARPLGKKGKAGLYGKKEKAKD